MKCVIMSKHICIHLKLCLKMRLWSFDSQRSIRQAQHRSCPALRTSVVSIIRPNMHKNHTSQKKMHGTHIAHVHAVHTHTQSKQPTYTHTHMHAQHSAHAHIRNTHTVPARHPRSDPCMQKTVVHMCMHACVHACACDNPQTRPCHQKQNVVFGDTTSQ